MTAAAPEIPARQFYRRPLAICGAAFAFAAGCALACHLEISASLGAFIGGVASVALFLPYFSNLVAKPQLKLCVSASFTAGIVVIWIVGATMHGISVSQLLSSVLVLAAFAAAVIGVAAAAERATRCQVAGSAIAIVLGLAWLSWPVWLSAQLPGSEALASWLVRLHPIFAINGAMPQLGAWTHQPLMYHLTNLGQDVAYQLPTSIWPCVIVHLVGGAALLLVSIRRTGGNDSR